MPILTILAASRLEPVAQYEYFVLLSLVIVVLGSLFAGVVVMRYLREVFGRRRNKPPVRDKSVKADPWTESGKRTEADANDEE